jgi:hypothetical protein
LELLGNISQAVVSHVVREFKLLWQNVFENSLKNSTATGSENLLSTGGVTLNERATMWKREV